MARSTKAAVLEDTVDTEEVVEAPSAKKTINEGITRVLEATDVTGQHNRYKAMRAIAFQAFVEAMEADDFEALVERAIENSGDLPSGWELARAEKVEKAAPVKKARKAATVEVDEDEDEAPAAKPVRKTAAKAKAAPAAKSARKRPTR